VLLTTLTVVKQWIYDIVSLFFPVYCPVCSMPLTHPGQVICLPCELNMPRTRYATDLENPVAQIFWGRVKLEGASALFRFEKGSKYQVLLHLLKYKSRKDIGIFLGKMIGVEIRGTPFADIDYLVPVPLHPRKQKKRGYNQSEVIASGISLITGIPVHPGILVRERNTDSQTRKNRFQRWQNMEGKFGLKDPSIFENCKVMLIDDVVTTGATLEACAATLMQITGIKIYIFTVACA